MEEETETESERAPKCGKERTYRNCIANSQHIIPYRYFVSRDISVPFLDMPGPERDRPEPEQNPPQHAAPTPDHEHREPRKYEELGNK